MYVYMYVIYAMYVMYVYKCMHAQFNCILLQDTSTSPFHWLAEILHELKHPKPTGGFRNVFCEEGTGLVMFYLLDDPVEKIGRESDTAVIHKTGLKFIVNDYTGSS